MLRLATILGLAGVVSVNAQAGSSADDPIEWNFQGDELDLQVADGQSVFFVSVAGNFDLHVFPAGTAVADLCAVEDAGLAVLLTDFTDSGLFEFVVDTTELGVDIGGTIILSNLLNNGCANGPTAVLAIDTPAPTESPTLSPTTLSPTFSPTLSPTGSPTLTPTQSPIITISNSIQWTIPANANRFFQQALITESEEILFNMVGTHNLLEFPTKEDFDECDFSNAEVLSAGNEEFLVDNFVVGEVRWFACNLTTAAAGEHCIDAGQKLAVFVEERGDIVTQSWITPKSENDLRNFEPFAINENQPIEFILNFELADNANDVHQIFSKEKFDNCDFDGSIELFPNEGESSIVHHDLFFKDLQEEILWYAAQGDEGDACRAGQKIAVTIGELTDAPTDAPDDDDNGDDDDDEPANEVIVFALAGVGGLVLLALIVFVVLRIRGGRNSGSGDDGMYKADVTTAAAPSADVEVERTPYRETVKSAGSESAPTSSLARDKAALSGLNF